MNKVNQTTINIYEGHADFQVEPGIGPVIQWHGDSVDLRKVTHLKAAAMAKDKGTRYVNFTPDALKRQGMAAIAGK